MVVELKDLKFDFEKQEYVNASGEVVEVEYGYDYFPCNLCHAPADLQESKYTLEKYKCLACDHVFNVE